MFMGAAGTIAEEQFTGCPSDNSHSVEILQLAIQRSTWFAGSLPEQKRYANFIWEQTKESIAAAHACRAAGTAVRKQAWRGNPRT